MTATRLCALSATTVYALACAIPAHATPDQPVPPAPPAPAQIISPPAELVPAIGNALGQAGSDSAGPLGLPDLSAYSTTLILGQNPAPAEPGATGPAEIPILNAFNPEYLLAQNEAPAAPGEGTPVPGIGPNAEDPGTGRIAFLRRLYEMYQAGDLKGALLGQQSPEEFEAAATEAG